MTLSDHAREYLQQVQRVMLQADYRDSFAIDIVGQVRGINLECPTSACAAGWCGFDPWFNERSFVARPESSARIGTTSIFDLVLRIGDVVAASGDLSRFFDIPHWDACAIFGWGSDYQPNDVTDVTALDVVANIELLLSTGETVNYRFDRKRLDTSPAAMDAIRARVCPEPA